MSRQVISGTVKNGVVVPQALLPEGADVEIRICDNIAEVPPDLQEELDAWQRARANALDLVDKLADEGVDGSPAIRPQHASPAPCSSNLTRKMA